MYRGVLVPLDGSPFGEQALGMAIALARATGARLHLVHVLSFTGEAQEDYLDAISERASEALSESVSFALVRPVEADPLFPPSDEDLAVTLVDYVRHHEIDVVIMATHGRGAVRRAWLGSVTDAFIRRSPVPVLLVRPGTAPPMEEPRLAHAVVPVDGSAVSALVTTRMDLLRNLGVERITLLHAIPPAVPIEAPYPLMGLDDLRLPRRREEALRQLQQLADPLRAAGVAINAVVPVAQDAAAAILDQARLNGADLIAMTTHGRAGWERMLLGSVAEQVLRRAPCPLLLFPPLSVQAETPAAAVSATVS